MKPDGLYDLLPAFLRNADAAEGEPLRALLAVLQGEYQTIQSNVAALYDDWFIETCDSWVVPYIADLLGVRGLDSPDLYWGSQRGLVGNVLSYRRRKGVADVLAAAAQGATGWPALAIPSNRLLAMTQGLSHLRPAQGRTVDLRDAEALDLLGGPFDSLAHTIDVRHGRFNLLRLGLFLWRLASYPVELAAPCQVGAGRYTFHPFGIDSPLFNPPRTGATVAAAALPAPLDGRLLADEVQALWTGEEPVGARLLDPRQPALRVWVRPRGVQAPLQPLPARSLLFCDLGGWQCPARRVYRRADGTPVEQRVLAAIDPARGRLAFPAGVEVDAVQVSYAYGFSDDLGGGPYSRAVAAVPPRGSWLAFVYTGAPAAAAAERPPAFPSLAAAVAAMAALPEAPEHVHAVIRLADNGVYDLPPAMSLAPRQSLTLQALDGMRPCVRGTLQVSGGASRGGATATVTLDGLWIDGGLVLGSGLGRVRLTHCTLRPPHPGDGPAASLATGGADVPSLTLEIDGCITGPLRLPGDIAGLTVERSILDGGAGVALAGPDGTSPGPPVTFGGCTVFGEVRVRQLRRAENTLFTAPVRVADSTEGTFDCCYVPAGAATPPSFTATVYGQPGYAQLAAGTPLKITTGSRDGSEIGVFHALRQPQRLANLPGTIAEYLRWGYEAAVVFVT